MTAQLGHHGDFILISHSGTYTMNVCIGNEINVYMLKSKKLHNHVKRMDMTTVYPSPTCVDIWLNMEFKASNWWICY